MPKIKDSGFKKIKNTIIDEEEKTLDPEVTIDNEEDEELIDEESSTLDIDDVDPFGDKWEQ